jgi:adenylate cyclase
MNPHICNYCHELLPPGGAEVDVAVLFADVRGSTELAEGISAREFTEIMNRFYDVVSTVLIRHHAVIDKLIGDEVMAFFVLASKPDPDGRGHHRLAVSAALEILEALGYEADDEPRLPVAVAVHAGPAFVGKIGREGVYTITALGDAVNTAARLQSEAEAGEILLGESIYESVASEHPDLPGRELTVKGKSRPVRVRSLRPGDTAMVAP